MRLSLNLTGWLALLLVLALTACGTTNVGSLTSPGDHQVAGVTLGGYEVLRYNAAGELDPSLNGTLDLRLDTVDNATALVISVSDTAYTTGVLLDVKYNVGSVHPVKADFSGALPGDSNSLTAAFLDQVPGVASVGAVAVGDYKPAALSGDAVTVYFENGAARFTSAADGSYVGAAGVGKIVEPTLGGGQPMLTGNGDLVNHTATVKWWSLWMRGDGDQNGLCGLPDLATIGVHFGKVITAAAGGNFAAIAADYDDNTQIAVADVAILGAHFGEITQDYVIEASDNVAAATPTAVTTVTWAAGTAPVPPVGDWPAFDSAARNWTVDFTATSAFTYAQLAALDADADGFARVYVTPHEASGTESSGSRAFVDVAVETPGVAITITDYDIQAVGATGGTGAGSDVFADGGAGSIVANADVTLQLNSVSGTYGGDPFSEGSLGTMTPALYAEVKGMVADALTWDFAYVGAAEARATTYGSWLASKATSITGDPGAQVACPDFDPESAAGTEEGTLDTTLASGSIGSTGDGNPVSAPAQLAYGYAFDLGLDPVAPEIEGYYTGPDFAAKYGDLTAGGPGSDMFFVKMNSWGASGGTFPASPETSQCELRKVDGKDASQGTITLAWDVDGDTDGVGPEPGEFLVFQTSPPLVLDVFQVNIADVTLQMGSTYALRWFDGTTWSSINLPTDMLGTQLPPPAEDLLTLPNKWDRERVPAYLQIFMNEPNVRRDDRVLLNLIAGTQTAIDQQGYDDKLKTGGTEFPIELNSENVGGHDVWIAYPKLVLKEGTTASDITGPDDPGADPNASIPSLDGRYTGRIAVDINALILNLPNGTPGDPDTTFVYKLYRPLGLEIGWGKFAVPQEPYDFASVQGVAWGINPGNRGDWNKADFNSLCTNFAVNGTSMLTTTPDVMWIRFNGNTRVVDYNEYWTDDDIQTDNLMVQIEDIENTTANLKLLMRVIGVTANNDYIAIHHFNLTSGGEYVDWVSAVPGWAGILTPGRSYTVKLDDPSIPGVEWTSPDPLSAIGDNPNA